MTKSKIVTPRTIIIDNATLRGALIALGLLDPPYFESQEPIKIFDVHVTSAEVLVETMLLYDHIYIPKIHENYYPTVERIQSVVGRDLIQELPLTQTQILTIEKFAAQYFASWPLTDQKLKSRLHEFVGTQTSAISWDRWDRKIFTSYLVEQTRYSWISNTYALAEYNISHLDTIEPESAQKILTDLFASYHINPEFDQFDAAVLWLTYRTCLYDCISWVTGIPYAPHPQRAALWKALNLLRSQPSVFFQVPIDILLDARLIVGNQVNKAFGLQVVDLKIPPFFTYILSKSASRFEVLSTVMEVREKGEVETLRTLLGTISAAMFEEGRTSKILNLNKQFDDLKDDLIAQYQDITLPKISPAIQLAGVASVQFDLPIPRSVRHLVSRLRTIHQPHLALLRDIFQISIDIWKLSDLYDKLFRDRQSLAKNTFLPPRDLNPADLIGTKAFLTPKILPGELFPGSKTFQDLEFITPLQFKEKLTMILLEHPTLPCQLAIIDIDDLDIFNQGGHVLGDVIIHKVAMCIIDIGINIVSKLVGDTFIAVVLGHSSNEWTKKLREKVSKLWPDPLLSSLYHPPHPHDWRLNFLPKQVSISIGLATSLNDGHLADDLFKVAYEQLEEEKRSKDGRRLDPHFWTNKWQSS